MKGKKKLSIVAIFVMLCLIPALILAVCTVFLASSHMRQAAENEIEGTLKATGYTLMETFSVVDTGNYQLIDGELFKGESNLSDDYEIVDTIKEETGVECTLFYGDTRYMTTVKDEKGDRMLLTQCSDEVKKIVLEQGNTYFAKNITIGGSDYYGYYIPVEQEGKVVGMYFTGKPSSDLTNATKEFFFFVLIACSVLLLIIVVAAFIIGGMLAKNIQVLRNDTVKLSEGNLNFKIQNKNVIREVYEVAGAMEALQNQLSTVVGSILTCSGTVNASAVHIDDSLENCASAVKDLSTTMEELAYGAQSMAGSVEKEAMDMDQISNNITAISDSSRATQEVTAKVTEVSEGAKKDLDELLKANSYTTESANNVISSISEVSDAVKQITTAAQMIMDISNQTNLLSLNASIEAARAGEAGRGFAVVASEIQKLAEQSNSSAQEIQTIIEKITSKTEECTKIAGQIQDAVGKESGALKSVNRSFDDVENNITNAADAVSKITDLVAITDKNKVGVLDSITDLSGISEENAACAEEANASAEELRANIEEVSTQAAELRNVVTQLEESVSFFKIS
ncbi:MAG: methyl-accepting chemotaxis protein [Bacteroidales bacterium]|nr:methyl-accepting chemotaxis protein [Lachnoclostridium sp.]MCM1384771.1 methyl-accepting chemotaxis protein [Lachnoclostridium sp.]MCM1465085.1 methyl-accepting chemotaxis protein [Bacteroidales bacterium]